jgi:hypothetical protein
MHLARGSELEQKHGYEGRGQEHHGVFRGARDELVEIDGHDEAYAEPVRVDALKPMIEVSPCLWN